MKHYKTVQVKIHSVGPLFLGDADHSHDRRNVCFHRIQDELMLDCFNAYLIGEDAHKATLKIGFPLEITYYSMQNGGKFIVDMKELHS